MRSFRLNFELTMEIYHEELAVRLERLIDSRKGARLTEETLDARRLPMRLWHASVRLMLPYL